jgi:3-deoxy-D-arabino-heptulosonate 7-phosphate (DAHP) synthase class II
LFISDPMHANTYQSQLGDKLKTRNYKDIMHELTYFRELMNIY